MNARRICLLEAYSLYDSLWGLRESFFLELDRALILLVKILDPADGM
jgi:hypothetical protein